MYVDSKLLSYNKDPVEIIVLRINSNIWDTEVVFSCADIEVICCNVYFLLWVTAGRSLLVFMILGSSRAPVTTV